MTRFLVKSNNPARRDHRHTALLASFFLSFLRAQVGAVWAQSLRENEAEGKTLRALRFQAGDYLDVAILGIDPRSSRDGGAGADETAGPSSSYHHHHHHNNVAGGGRGDDDEQYHFRRARYLR
mmetsp:Transcript_26654/g.106765  ORF Transcript_26654/g.106765 Transcript_26654/m.106765 type:complete len:123 (-) Transcript_26654:1245-1613(-)